MFTGYSTVSCAVILWLMLGYFYFSYLIRIVVFFNRHHYLDCCTVLSSKVFLQFLLLWRLSLFCPPFFHSLLSGLFYNVDVCTFSWTLTLFGTLLYTVFVRVVITVTAFGQLPKSHHNNKICRKTLPDNTVQQSRERYRLKNTTIIFK